jgi:CubicO group peptidase (beta-lactamase class C family)
MHMKLSATGLALGAVLWASSAWAQTPAGRPVPNEPPPPVAFTPEGFLIIPPATSPPGRTPSPSPQTKFSAEDEALMLKRSDDLAQAARVGQGLEGYDPVEAVPGAKTVRALPTASARQRTIKPEALAAVRDYAEKNNSQALIVWRNGRIEEEAYFRGATAQTPIVSRSLAKPITALAIGRAIQLGKIKSLEQPVADFVPEWKTGPRSRITVRMLLNMTSGFLPQDFSVDPQHILNRAYLHPRHDEIIINEYPLTHEPGTRYEYNNATSEMVAPVIERATGRRYAEFVSTEILQKIGSPGGTVWINRLGGVAHSGCCIMLPAEAWVRMAVLILDDGVWQGQRLLPKGYVAQMKTGSKPYARYGLGLYIGHTYTERRGFANEERPVPKTLHTEPFLDKDLVLMDGNANQVVYISPGNRLIALRVGGNPPRKPEWDNSFIPNTLMRGINRKPGEKTPEPQPR